MEWEWEDEEVFGGSEEGITDLQVLQMLQLAFLVAVGMKATRSASFFEQRLCWVAYCQRHVARGTFKRRLRMEKESFDILLSHVHNFLLVNEEKAKIRGGPIIPELCLYCTLRWLAGGSYLDICDIVGISKASFYRVILSEFLS